MSAELRRLAGGSTLRLARQLEERTGLESRVTILGHLQRGGAAAAADRLLATLLGAASAEVVKGGTYRHARRGSGARAVGGSGRKRRIVPVDPARIDSARAVGTSWGTSERGCQVSTSVVNAPDCDASPC